MIRPPRHLAIAGVLSAVLCLAAGVRPASATTVSVVSPDTMVTVTEDFAVRIVTSPVSDLKAFQLVFSYDPTVLQFLGADPGDVLTSSGREYRAFVTNDVGPTTASITYDAAMLDGATEGPGILAFFRFRALLEGTSLIECGTIDYRNSNNDQSFPACQGGRVVVVGPVPTRPLTWGSLKTIYR